MAEWLRSRVFISENRLNIRRISVGSKSCPSRKTVCWADGDKNHVPSLLWQAEADIYLEGRMAEWLRPRVFIAENGLNIRRISVGSKSCPSRKSIGWADGDKKHVPSLLWQAEADIYLEGRMAEWLRPRVFIAENGLNIRRISVG